jgi:hypothetical protein
MSGYNIERIKKEREQNSLDYFLEAYERVTGEMLEVLEAIERPDFVCMRETGIKVGVELVNVRRSHPKDILYGRIVEKLDFMSPEHALEMIQSVGVNKEKKRNGLDWKLPEATILLIELWDIPLAQIASFISPAIIPDLYSTGFEEIWLTDFTGLGAYGDVELFCIRPEDWAGYHRRMYQKPYG